MEIQFVSTGFQSGNFKLNNHVGHQYSGIEYFNYKTVKFKRIKFLKKIFYLILQNNSIKKNRVPAKKLQHLVDPPSE